MAKKQLPKFIKKLLPEFAKDAIYRTSGHYPPTPPSDPPVGELTDKWLRDISNIKTVCLFLGPNRNLTTLTASVLALHPHCQVMSHGGARILPVNELNFLHNYSDEKFAKFCQFIIKKSGARDKGAFGGSITITHAFRYHEDVAKAYRWRYGRSLTKKSIHSLIWKEAHMVDDYVTQHNVDLGSLVNQNPKLRFIMPVRNPLNVAYSFYSREGFRRKFYNHAETTSVQEILNDILTRMARVMKFHVALPQNVMVFFENEITDSLFEQFASFLEIEPEKRWLKDAKRLFKISSDQYEIPDEVKSYYVDRIKTLFLDSPEIHDLFRQYV